MSATPPSASNVSQTTSNPAQNIETTAKSRQLTRTTRVNAGLNAKVNEYGVSKLSSDQISNPPTKLNSTLAPLSEQSAPKPTSASTHQVAGRVVLQGGKSFMVQNRGPAKQVYSESKDDANATTKHIAKNDDITKPHVQAERNKDLISLQNQLRSTQVKPAQSENIPPTPPTKEEIARHAVLKEKIDTQYYKMAANPHIPEYEKGGFLKEHLQIAKQHALTSSEQQEYQELQIKMKSKPRANKTHLQNEYQKLMQKHAPPISTHRSQYDDIPGPPA